MQRGRRLLGGVLAVALVAAAVLVATTVPAGAAGPIVVTTTADVVDGGDGVLSLREAVSLANAQPGADEIVLDAGATYTLSICPPSGGSDDWGNALGSVDVTGADGLTIRGNGARVDQVCPDSLVLWTWASASVVIEDLHATSVGLGVLAGLQLDVRDSHVSGGGVGIYVLESLALADSLVEGATTGISVQPDASATVDRSTISGNGSGIVGSRDAAAVTVRFSQVIDNTCPGPTGCSGGIVSGGAIVVEDSLVARNGAATTGGSGERPLGGIGSLNGALGASGTVRVERSRSSRTRATREGSTGRLEGSRSSIRRSAPTTVAGTRAVWRSRSAPSCWTTP